MNAIRLLGQTDEFRGWLVTYHGIQNDRDLFEGYKFALDVLSRLLHDAIAYKSSLNLSEDLVFSRARFVGIPLHKVPNSCDKAILLKNIHANAKGILRARAWSELDEGINQFEKEILSPFDNLKSASVVSPHYNISNLDEAVLYSSMFQVYIFLNDTRRGLPHGYRQSMLEDSLFEGFRLKNKEYLRRVFEGYTYSIQFLWHCLLEDRFSETSLVELHESADWYELDKYFARIQSEIIKPLEKETGASWGLDSLIHLAGPADKALEHLLVFKPPEPKLSEKEQLEQAFLWYEIELIDASESTVFNGVATFVSLLTGTVEMKRRIGAREKVHVIRLVHPTDEPNRRDFSYAILEEIFGSFGISDYSGWLLFYDCCYDSGSGVQELRFAEQCISDYLRDGLIELMERTVDKGEFLKLMGKSLLSTTKQAIFGVEQTRNALRVATDKLGTSSGLLLEFLGYYAFSPSSSDGDVKRIDWNYNRLDQQIDILVRDRTSLTFIECRKPSIDDPLEQGKKLRKKARILLGDAEFKREWEIDERTQIRYMLLTWDRPQQMTIESLNRQGIEIVILSEEVRRHPKFLGKSKDKLRKVFDRERILTSGVKETDGVASGDEEGGEVLEI